MTLTHVCNAYCRESSHCELWWFGPPLPHDPERRRRQVENVTAYRYGLYVDRVEPAPEAQKGAPEERVLGLGPAQHPYLVWLH